MFKLGSKIKVKIDSNYFKKGASGVIVNIASKQNPPFAFVQFDNQDVKDNCLGNKQWLVELADLELY